MTSDFLKEPAHRQYLHFTFETTDLLTTCHSNNLGAQLGKLLAIPKVRQGELPQ
jgi:hypothetical protein